MADQLSVSVSTDNKITTAVVTLNGVAVDAEVQWSPDLDWVPAPRGVATTPMTQPFDGGLQFAVTARAVVGGQWLSSAPVKAIALLPDGTPGTVGSIGGASIDTNIADIQPLDGTARPGGASGKAAAAEHTHAFEFGLVGTAESLIENILNSCIHTSVFTSVQFLSADPPTDRAKLQLTAYQWGAPPISLPFQVCMDGSDADAGFDQLYDDLAWDNPATLAEVAATLSDLLPSGLVATSGAGYIQISQAAPNNGWFVTATSDEPHGITTANGTAADHYVGDGVTSVALPAGRYLGDLIVPGGITVAGNNGPIIAGNVTCALGEATFTDCVITGIAAGEIKRDVEVWLASFFKVADNPYALHTFYSADGINLTEITPSTPYTDPDSGTVVKDSSFVWWAPLQKWVVAYTKYTTSDGSKHVIGLAVSSDFINWQHYCDITIAVNPGDPLSVTAWCWAPELFLDASGQLYMLLWAPGLTSPYGCPILYLTPVSLHLTIWSRPVALDVGSALINHGAGDPAICYSAVDKCYYLACCGTAGSAANTILIFSSPTIIGAAWLNVADFHLIGNKTGGTVGGSLDSQLEGPSIVTKSDGSMRCYFDAFGLSNGDIYYIDSTGAAGNSWASYSTAAKVIVASGTIRHGTVRRVHMTTADYDMLTTG